MSEQFEQPEKLLSDVHLSLVIWSSDTHGSNFAGLSTPNDEYELAKELQQYRQRWDGAIAAAKADGINEGLERAAMAQCSRCRSNVPLVKHNGFTMHEYYKGSDYRDCSALAIRALKTGDKG